MPLHILLILVVGGIASIALALHLLGLSQAPTFALETARTAWLRARPDDVIETIKITADGRAARIITDRGHGILWQMGADTCARLLTGTETLNFGAKTAILYLNDYAAPKVLLHLTPDEQIEWQDWITQR
ncbi:hypothetical protein [uncultured Tateyamaria sp.]|uniref:hypothetical protein n=1 Tax=uncultured Tateyamaria sp. TaxID=455651 RepID=UPI00262A09B8|nr:hypothetical protein [uncultured Tateyamaria sp.]